MRREIVEAAGGFDERFWGTEDGSVAPHCVRGLSLREGRRTPRHVSPTRRLGSVDPERMSRGLQDLKTVAEDWDVSDRGQGASPVACGPVPTQVEEARSRVPEGGSPRARSACQTRRRAPKLWVFGAASRSGRRARSDRALARGKPRNQALSPIYSTTSFASSKGRRFPIRGIAARIRGPMKGMPSYISASTESRLSILASLALS